MLSTQRSSAIGKAIFLEENPSYVFKLNKSLYGLKQAPRAWCKRLSKFLIDNKFKHRNVDTILFIKKRNENLLVVQVYIDDIIFGATTHSLYKEFANLIKGKFEMSMMGEMNFFLRLQIKQEKKEYS